MNTSMKNYSHIQAPVFLLFFCLSFAVSHVSATTSCDITNMRLITRHWSLLPNATMTTIDVATTFQSGFGPQVSMLSGFQLYQGSVVNSTDTYFQNVFEGFQNSQDAQAAAAGFVASSTLSGQITKVVFNQGNLDFFITSDSECYSLNATGFYIATRYWQLKPGATMTVQQVSEEFHSSFAPIISQQPGFRTYASMIPDAVNAIQAYNFFFNIFETSSQAAAASTLAASFVADGILADQIQKVEFLEAHLQFDITPVSSGASIIYSNSVFEVVLFMIFLNILIFDC